MTLQTGVSDKEKRKNKKRERERERDREREGRGISLARVVKYLWGGGDFTWRGLVSDKSHECVPRPIISIFNGFDGGSGRI
jgi:ribosomal protein S8E